MYIKNTINKRKTKTKDSCNIHDWQMDNVIYIDKALMGMEKLLNYEQSVH